MQIDIISLLSAISVIMLGVLQWRNARRTATADSNAVDVKTFHDQVNTVKQLSTDMVSINKRLGEMEKKNSALWHYVYELIEFIQNHGIIPPLPPVELETDPKLSKLINRKS